MIDIEKYFKKAELIPAIIQEDGTNEVLMLAYMNRESMQKTLETGYTWFWSRSRQELWNKGATSGHLQKIVLMDLIKEEYQVIIDRKNEQAEGSYTAYLFEQGIDKILKKVGEECTEMVIAAKNNDKEETVYEVTDLIYHTLVMMAYQGITPEDIEEELKKRAAKRGNLKKFHQVDKNS